MKNTKTKVALAIASVLVAGTAQAATTHTLTNGDFNFYDSSGVLADSHSDVQGSFDLMNGTGAFTTSTPFTGETWVADVYNITMHSSAMGGTSTAAESHTYAFERFLYVTDAEASALTGVNIGVTADCTVSARFDGCAQVGILPGVETLFSVTGQFDYDLLPGMFGVETYFDWSVNIDIPVLAVLQVTSGNPMTGPATVVSVDTDAAADTLAGRTGTPGTAMLVGPFPGQTPSFAGTMVPVPVPVPAAVWLFGSGLLGLVGVARRKKASV